jgi:hypothetical protein
MIKEKVGYRSVAQQEVREALKNKYAVNWAYVCSSPTRCIRQHVISEEEGLVLCLASSSMIQLVRCQPQFS